MDLRGIIENAVSPLQLGCGIGAYILAYIIEDLFNFLPSTTDTVAVLGCGIGIMSAIIIEAWIVSNQNTRLIDSMDSMEKEFKETGAQKLLDRMHRVRYTRKFLTNKEIADKLRIVLDDYHNGKN